jgi:signal transduction histidine kinase
MVREGRGYFLGVRGKLLLSLLFLVVLSMWLLGLALMKLTKSAITAQMAARGETITSAIEHVIEAINADTSEEVFPYRVEALLQSMARNPEVASMKVFDRSGSLMASAGTPPPGDLSGERDPFPTYRSPLPFRPGERGSIEIVFSPHGMRRQLGLALMRIVAQLAITVLVLILSINIIVSLTVLAPVRKLLRATVRIAGGDLDSPVEMGARDEFGDLALSFNTMLDKLRQSEELNRQQLDSLRRAHDNLQSKEARLITAEKMAAVGRVAAGVAHEVGNPLGSVTGYLAMLRDESLDDGEKMECLARTEKELARINRIMLDLLNYARPPRPELTELDLNVVLRDVHLLLSSQPEFAETVFLLELGEGIPPIRGDYHSLQQMLVNIMLNAAQSMPGGGEVVVRSFGGGAGKDGAGFSITDHGPGIAAGDLPQIFEPFFTTRTGGRGSGLGLPLCKQIAFSMGAAIEVDSTPGVGSTFTVAFPPPREGTGRDREND